MNTLQYVLFSYFVLLITYSYSEDYLREKFNFKGDEKLQLLNFSSSLRNQLFSQNGGYKVADEPLTRVGFRFEGTRLEKFDEIAGELYLLSSIVMFWSDNRLTWDTSSIAVHQEKTAMNYSITYLQMKLGEIWKPDIRLFNPLGEMDIFNGKGNEAALLGSVGVLFYDGLVKTGTHCEPNLEQFPFDEHECSVQFVVTSTMIANMPQKTQVYYDNAKWIYFQMQPCDLNLAPSRFGDEHRNERRVLVFPFKFIRRSAFVFLNIAVPLLVLSLLNTIVYFIPGVPEERLSFCVALLLSFTVYLIYVAGLIPETSNPVPLIIYFLVFQFLLSAFITCSSFLTAMLNKREQTTPIPFLIKRLAIFFFSPCSRKIGNDSKSGNIVQDKIDELSSEEQRMPEDDVIKNSNAISIEVTWKMVALLIERCCMIVTFAVLVLEIMLFAYLASKLSANVEPTYQSAICRSNPLNSTHICLDDVSGICVNPAIIPD